MNITNRSIILCALLLSCTPFSFAKNWKLDKTIDISNSNEKVYVYTRPIKGQVLKQFKGITTLDASLLSTFKAISDLSNASNWMYNNKQSKFITGKNGNPYIYVQIAGPGPVADRDTVLKNSVTQENGIITINNVSAKGQLKEQSGHKRMTNVASTWILEPISPEQTKLTFIGHAEPGGLIPNWVANLVVSKMPSVSLKNLHSEVAKDKYRNAKKSDLRPRTYDLKNLSFE